MIDSSGTTVDGRNYTPLDDAVNDFL
jgi:hypothetical protein